MTAAQDEHLDDLLCRWWAWLHPIRVSKGYDHASCGVGRYKSGTGFDEANGVHDERIEHMTCRAIDASIHELVFPWSAAIMMVARNLSGGAHVWNSPRLPVGPELEAIVLSARAQAVKKLRNAGVM